MKAAPENTPEERVFWNPADAPAAGTLEYKRRLGEQISRLQQRQLELVQHTSNELESLKRELEESSILEERVEAATQPLLDQIALLKAQNESLEETLRIAEETYRSRYSQVHSTVTALKNAIRGQARAMDQQLRVFNLDTGQSIESMIASIEAAHLPTFDEVASPAHKAPSLLTHEPKPAPVQHPAFEAHEEKLKKEAKAAPVEKPADETPRLKSPRRGTLRRFAVRGITVVLVATMGYGSMKAIKPFVTGSPSEVGTVAGVSTDSSLTAPVPEYAESWADVAYAKTEWDTTTDSAFGISFQYPKNASNRVRTIGGSNLWILRKNHYLLNVRQDDATTLDAWQAANADTVAEYTVAKGTFKGQPALILTSKEDADGESGTMYVVARPVVGTLSIWVRDEDPTSDDGLRVKKMIDTFAFSTAVK